ILMEALNEFKGVSGLVPSIPKSTILFCNVPDQVKSAILHLMPFERGEMQRGKAKVAWEDLCLLKLESGLGVRKLQTFNIALMTNHILKLITHKESLWVKWVHSYKLKPGSFWDVPLRSNVSWGWRKLLQIRNIIRPHIWYKLGNGNKTSAWFDKWDDRCSLMSHLSYRAISSASFNFQEKGEGCGGEWGLVLAKFMGTYGVFVPFNVRDTWDTIRERGTEVEWYHLV
ncbi:hypothetical protein Tco_1398276, partial [Tanacetum coccineum]